MSYFLIYAFWPCSFQTYIACLFEKLWDWKYGTHNKPTSHTREHLVNFVGYLEITRDCVHMTVTMHIRARTRIVARHDQHMDNNYYNIVSARLCAYIQD